MKDLSNIILLALLVLPFGVSAQKEKVVEASSKHKPAWIGQSDATSLSVTEEGKSLSEASDRCLATIRQHILNAVAVNISSTETMTSRQITYDNLVTVMNDYRSNLMTEAAKLPYVSDITLSNAEEIYWERIYSKQDKSYRYEYSVRYPFTEETRRELVESFLAIDNAKAAEYERLRGELETITDLDRIRPAINELEGLYDYFFDATRRRETATLRQNYLDLYKQISIRIESETLGSCLYSLRLNGRRVTTSLQPRLTSESALEMKVEACDDGCYRLTYNPEYASKTDINRIDILYLFGGTRITKTIFFDPAQQQATLQAIGTVRIEQSAGKLSGTLQLRIKGEAVEVVSLSLRNPADGAEIPVRLTGRVHLDEGERSLNFDSGTQMDRNREGVEIIRGTVTYKNTADGRTTETGFTLPYKLTNK